MSSEARLPAHVEVAALIRRTQAEGGFAAVLKRGEAEAGTVLLVLTGNGTYPRLYERMPQLDGERKWHCTKVQDTENSYEFSEYLARRGVQDSDVWIVELDIAQAERLIGLPPPGG